MELCWGSLNVAYCIAYNITTTIIKIHKRRGLLEYSYSMYSYIMEMKWKFCNAIKIQFVT